MQTDKIESRSTRTTHVRENEVDLAWDSPNSGVEGPGPDLRVGGKLIGFLKRS
jgi:hypothetical protein